jgi:hypothetical protein
MDPQPQPNQKFQTRPAVPNALPKNQRPQDNLITRLNSVVNKDVALLVIIIILVLVIMGMSVFVMSSLTNTGVNITFTRDSASIDTEVSNESVTQDSNTIQDNTDQQDDVVVPATIITDDLTFYMTAVQHQGDVSSLPIGSKASAIQGVFTVPVISKITFDTRDGELESALNSLFGQQDVLYQNVFLNNYFSLSDVAASVDVSAGSALVDISGEIVIAGDLAGQYLREQLESTVEEYVDDYVITLNGSVTEYDCFDDSSGLCGL